MRGMKTSEAAPAATRAKNHVARIVAVWSEYAGEAVTIDPSVHGSAIGSPITVFGSELGMLRLHYRMKEGRVEFSKNLGTWFYCNK
jgi:hypothetical protein